MVVSDVTLLHDPIELQKQVRPHHIAIHDDLGEMSYLKLAEESDRIAAVLASEGINRGDRVALLLNNGRLACVSILGTLCSGACYVPLNLEWPARRIASVLEDADVAAVIVASEDLQLLLDAIEHLSARPRWTLIAPDLMRANIKDITKRMTGDVLLKIRDAEDIASAGAPPRVELTPDDLAYIIYTSGSTGLPKGVTLTHANVMMTIKWGVRYFGLTPEDKISNHSRLSFDVCMFDIFTAFLAGSTLCPITSPADIAFPGDFIREKKVSLWVSVPSVISYMEMAGQLSDGPFSSLRHAGFIGEALMPNAVCTWLKHQSNVPIHNLYGPTEASIICSAHEVTLDDLNNPSQRIPIGKATDGCEIVVFNLHNDQVCENDEIGRLMICGDVVSPGYWRQPTLTKTKFGMRPSHSPSIRMYSSGDLALQGKSNLLEFIGREDTQIKLNGYRIELEEIESVLTSYETVSEAAVVHMSEPDQTIIGVVVMNGDVIVDDLFIHLEDRLPAYSIPSEIVFIDALPRNSNGKVDRQNLKANIHKLAETKKNEMK